MVSSFLHRGNEVIQDKLGVEVKFLISERISHQEQRVQHVVMQFGKFSFQQNGVNVFQPTLMSSCAH